MHSGMCVIGVRVCVYVCVCVCTVGGGGGGSLVESLFGMFLPWNHYMLLVALLNNLYMCMCICVCMCVCVLSRSVVVE